MEAVSYERGTPVPACQLWPTTNLRPAGASHSLVGRVLLDGTLGAISLLPVLGATSSSLLTLGGICFVALSRRRGGSSAGFLQQQLLDKINTFRRLNVLYDVPNFTRTELEGAYLDPKWLDLYQSRDAVGHAVSDIRHCVTKRLKGEVTWDFYESTGCIILICRASSGSPGLDWGESVIIGLRAGAPVQIKYI